jgi:hypothetical protein
MDLIPEIKRKNIFWVGFIYRLEAILVENLNTLEIISFE